jgi:hypothetical protein
MATTELVPHPDLEAQRQYVKRVRASGAEVSVMVADAFVRGIRHLGYKSTAHAIDELVDNALQAGASETHVVLGYDVPDRKVGDRTSVTRIAVLDNGHGMDPEMIELAVRWGGGHREETAPAGRRGMGRFGYGLPSASVSQGTRFTVYSQVLGGQLHALTIDLTALNNPETGRIEFPPAAPATVPDWLQSYVGEHFESEGLTQGTIVVLEDLDKHAPKTYGALHRTLLEHFGIAYRNFLGRQDIFVNGAPVEATDPLFITPGLRYHDVDDDRAEPQDPMPVDVKIGGEYLGQIKIRVSYLPPTFGQKNKVTGGGRNPRSAIMGDHLGLIIMREGRQIDVLNKVFGRTVQNNDRFWQVEVDFPASLDDEFQITTSKQQVVPTDRIWKILEEAGLKRVINGLHDRYDREAAVLKTERDEAKENQKRASELAMEESEVYRTPLPGSDPDARRQRGEQNLQAVAQRRARETGWPEAEVAKELEAQTTGQHYKVESEHVPGAPFYRVEQFGSQVRLYLNEAHRFYRDVYAGPEAGPHTRAALEVLLFVMGEAELDAPPKLQEIYQQERQAWSMRLGPCLDELNDLEDVDERQAAAAAAVEEAEDAAAGKDAGSSSEALV